MLVFTFPSGMALFAVLCVVLDKHSYARVAFPYLADTVRGGAQVCLDVRFHWVTCSSPVTILTTCDNKNNCTFTLYLCAVLQ